MKNRVLGLAGKTSIPLAPRLSLAEYAKRLLAAVTGVQGAVATHRTSHRTVAQDKRDAVKRRNRLRAKR